MEELQTSKGEKTKDNELSFESNLPQDFKKILDFLEKFAN